MRFSGFLFCWKRWHECRLHNGMHYLYQELPMGQKAVILLSGGLDSATTAAIARDRGFETFSADLRLRAETQRRNEFCEKACGFFRHIGPQDNHHSFSHIPHRPGEVFGNRCAQEPGPWSRGDTGYLRSGKKHYFSVLRPGLRGVDRRLPYLYRGQCR